MQQEEKETEVDMTNRNGRKVKKLLKIIGGLLAIVFVAVIGYVAYVFLSYDRIEDRQALEINQPKASKKDFQSDFVNTGKTYTVGTYNVGFGAYLPDYSFFMDGGEYSRCYSGESGADTIQKAAGLALQYKPDFMMFQEVDRDSTRSYHVNQEALITDIFDNYYETFAVNYDSAYLLYPFTEPIGASYSGIAMYSKYEIRESLRRSLPISTGFSKFLDLDRCYSINRVKVDNGKEADSENCESWAYPFPRSRMPKGIGFAMDRLEEEAVANMPESGRNSDMEYIPGETFTCTLDGFIISDNIDLEDYKVIDSGFAYSDHEPVFMDFQLK